MERDSCRGATVHFSLSRRRFDWTSMRARRNALVEGRNPWRRAMGAGHVNGIEIVLLEVPIRHVHPGAISPRSTTQNAVEKRHRMLFVRRPRRVNGHGQHVDRDRYRVPKALPAIPLPRSAKPDSLRNDLFFYLPARSASIESRALARRFRPGTPARPPDRWQGITSPVQ